MTFNPQTNLFIPLRRREPSDLYGIKSLLKVELNWLQEYRNSILRFIILISILIERLVRLLSLFFMAKVCKFDYFEKC
jgi:hypothetical protein